MIGMKTITDREGTRLGEPENGRTNLTAGEHDQ